jgi:hypothetical protein
VRIDHVQSFPARGGAASARTSDPSGTSQASASVQGQGVPQADVVHLTLSSDGIWQVGPASQSDPSFARTPHHRTAFQMPRLYPSVTQLYTPTGRPQASPPARGLVLDLYA